MRREELMEMLNDSYSCGLPTHAANTRTLAETVERLQHEVRMLAKAYQDLAVGRCAPNQQILVRIQRGELG